MNLKTRRIIYFTFIILFLILAPLTILYTAGYRYDFNRHKILKTGGIFLYIKTPRVQVFLNDQLKKETGIFGNEVRLNNLIPNIYNIKVQKEGYYPWEKNLRVHSGETTFAEHIILFKKSMPEKTVSSEAELINFSPDEKFISYIDKKEGAAEIWIYNSETKEQSLLYRSTEESFEDIPREEIISWSAGSEKIILTYSKNDKKQYIIFDSLANEDPLPLGKITNVEFKKILWSPFNDNLLYGLGSNAIYRINLFNESSEKITSEPKSETTLLVSDFAIKNNNFYYIEITDKNSFIVRKDLSGGESERIVSMEAEVWNFVNGGPGNIITLLGSKNQKLRLINIDSKTINLEKTASQAQWSDNAERLLFYNDFELWSYNIEDTEPILITRYSREIKKAAWVPGFDYITFILGDELNIIELDGRDGRNLYDITGGAKINSFIFDSDGEYIYFAGNVDEEPGLYKLTIK